jgi:DNA-binding MarR family transcriptional regulator
MRKAPSSSRTEKRPAPKPARGRRAVALGALEDFLGFHLRVAQDASFRAFARHAGDADLRPGRFAAMMVIHNNPGISQIALSRAIARDKSSVTPLIQDLVKKGYVARRTSTVDRRSVTLTLTPPGEAKFRGLFAEATQHDQRLDAIVGPHKAEFIRLLRKIADELG